MDLWPEESEFGHLDSVFEPPIGRRADRYGLVRIGAVLEEACLPLSGLHGIEVLRALDPVEYERVLRGPRMAVLLPFLMDPVDEERLLREFGLTPEGLRSKVTSGRVRLTEPES